MRGVSVNNGVEGGSRQSPKRRVTPNSSEVLLSSPLLFPGTEQAIYGLPTTMRRLLLFLCLWVMRSGAFSPRSSHLTLHAWCSSAFCPGERRGKCVAVGRQPHNLVTRTVSVDISGGASDTVTLSSVWGVAGVSTTAPKTPPPPLPFCLGFHFRSQFLFHWVIRRFWPCSSTRSNASFLLLSNPFSRRRRD